MKHMRKAVFYDEAHAHPPVFTIKHMKFTIKHILRFVLQEPEPDFHVLHRKSSKGIAFLRFGTAASGPDRIR